MTKKYIWTLAIVGAFAAGTILSSAFYENSAFAIHQPNHNPGGEDDEDMGWMEAVAGLQNQIDNIDTQDEILGFYKIGEGSEATASEESNGVSNRVAFCDDGDLVTGGGFSASPDATAKVVTSGKDQSVASPKWIVQFTGATEGDFLGASVNCADYAPEHIP